MQKDERVDEVVKKDDGREVESEVPELQDFFR